MVWQFDCFWSLLSSIVNFFKLLKRAISLQVLPPRPEPTQDSAEDAGEGKKQMSGLDSSVPSRVRRRPVRIAIPENSGWAGFDEMEKEKDLGEEEAEVEEREYYVVSRKGSRRLMEDGFRVITNINGDPKQGFFAVYDGHGGRAAMEFVRTNLGKKIVAATAELEKEEDLELAIREAYLATDKEFLAQVGESGVCVATVLIKHGKMFAANVGDCRVVMSKNGVAKALTDDHRPTRQDERARIENSGGYVNIYYGTWRVQGTLAVSRAIGDANLKQWIIAKPDITKLRLTSDCEFLILASDGLWDKVTNQEAVDVVKRDRGNMQCCKELVEISRRRGCRDDVTVMVVNLERFA